mgnify:CR=1 FL=1
MMQPSASFFPVVRLFSCGVGVNLVTVSFVCSINGVHCSLDWVKFGILVLVVACLPQLCWGYLSPPCWRKLALCILTSCRRTSLNPACLSRLASSFSFHIVLALFFTNVVIIFLMIRRHQVGHLADWVMVVDHFVFYAVHQNTWNDTHQLLLSPWLMLCMLNDFLIYISYF